MEEQIEFTWYVEDGYMTGDRPQTTYVDIDEIKSCDCIEDALSLIGEAIQSDFEEHVGQDYSTDAFTVAIEKFFPNPKQAGAGR